MSKDTTNKLKRLSAIWDWIDNSESKIYSRPEEGGYFSIKEWAQKFSTSSRTIMRDLALIKEMGIEFFYLRGKGYALLTSEFGFSLEYLHLTPQMAAALCLAYDEAKRAGKAFHGVCQEIKSRFIPQIENCEINPPLPDSAIVKTIRRAIKNRYYVKITTLSGVEKYIKPYCFICIAKKKTDLVYIEKRNLPPQALMESVEDFFAISLKSIAQAHIAIPSARFKSLQFPRLKHQKWAAFSFIRFHTECFLEKNK